MGLKEKLCSDGKNVFKKFARKSLVSLLATTMAATPFLIFNSCKFHKPLTYDYTTTTTPVTSEYIEADQGGIVDTYGLEEPINARLTIPAGGLQEDEIIELEVTNNPTTTLPEIEGGILNYVGAPVNIEPSGTTFDKPLTLDIYYNDAELSDAGINDETKLRLFGYDTLNDSWEEVPIKSRDLENNLITAEINHFSYYAVLGWIGKPDKNLGVPQSGDLLYKTGSIFNKSSKFWMPGHVGIYTGEKDYSIECQDSNEKSCLASDEVKHFRKYNVVEALDDGVQYSYYDIPNVTETYEDEKLPKFEGGDLYMGAREPKIGALTEQQREKVVSFVEAQIGKPYLWEQTVGAFFGMLAGSFVKGPDKFNCVGLAEAAYEYAGVNNGIGLTTHWQEDGTILTPQGTVTRAALTPAEHYNQTRPAGCNDIVDTDCDGCISTPEIINAIDLWKNEGAISISKLLGYISLWKQCNSNKESFVVGEWDEHLDPNCDGDIGEPNKLIFHEDHTFESIPRCNGYEGAWGLLGDELTFTYNGCDYSAYKGKLNDSMNSFHGEIEGEDFCFWGDKVSGEE